MIPAQRGSLPVAHAGKAQAYGRADGDWLAGSPLLRSFVSLVGLCLQCAMLMTVLWFVASSTHGISTPASSSAAASRRDLGFDLARVNAANAAAAAAAAAAPGVATPPALLSAQEGPELADQVPAALATAPPAAPAPGPAPAEQPPLPAPAPAAPAAPAEEWCPSDHSVGGMRVHTINRCLTPGAAAPEDALCADAADGRPRVLISVVAFANESFGVIRDHGLMGKGARGLDGFLGMLAEQDYPACRLSLGLLVSNEAFFKAASDSVNRFVRERGMARGVVTYKHLDTGIDPDKRHTFAAQRVRRGTLARLRNAAVSVALTLEDAVLWVDADVTNMPPHTLTTLVGSGKDVITTITKGWDENNYDLNAWTLPRKPYNASEGADFVPESLKGVARFSTDFENGPEPFVPLDSVGGCTTLVRANVHREGALFAPYYVIGTTWEKDGYDGVESEGLCYVAKFLGRSCWLATQIVTHHQSYWA